MCIITGLEKDTNYVFMCRAMNDRGFWSDWSDVSEVVRTRKGEHEEREERNRTGAGAC